MTREGILKSRRERAAEKRAQLRGFLDAGGVRPRCVGCGKRLDFVVLDGDRMVWGYRGLGRFHSLTCAWKWAEDRAMADEANRRTAIGRG